MLLSLEEGTKFKFYKVVDVFYLGEVRRGYLLEQKVSHRELGWEVLVVLDVVDLELFGNHHQVDVDDKLLAAHALFLPLALRRDVLLTRSKNMTQRNRVLVRNVLTFWRLRDYEVRNLSNLHILEILGYKVVFMILRNLHIH